MSDTILFLSHTEADGKLSKAALEALGAAIDLAVGMGAPLTVGLFGGDTHEAANSIANCGAHRFLALAGPEFEEARYSTDAGAAEIICRSAVPSIVVTPATARCARIMPGVAFRLAGRADTHVNSIAVTDGKATITRWFYRQRMVAEMSRTQRPWVLVYETGCHAAYSGAPGTAQVELLKLVVGDEYKRTKVSGIIAPKANEQTIRPEAELLFVAGAGWTKKQKDGQSHPEDAEKLILGFLHGTNASLGSSKSLVDLSGEGQAVLQFMSHMNQVGQTGATPRHPKGLSTCCHGEEPHVVGWRFINERRAINLDPNCGWARGKADVLYVADAFEVMTKVNALLATKKELVATAR